MICRGVAALGNGRARSPDPGGADSRPRSGSGLGVKVCLGSGLCLGLGQWAPSFHPPCTRLRAWPPLVSGGGASPLASLLCVRTVSNLSRSQGQPVKGSDSFCFLGREEDLLCGNHQFKGMNLAATPSRQRESGQGPVRRRKQAWLQKGFCLRPGRRPE